MIPAAGVTFKTPDIIPAIHVAADRRIHTNAPTADGSRQDRVAQCSTFSTSPRTSLTLNGLVSRCSPD